MNLSGNWIIDVHNETRRFLSQYQCHNAIWIHTDLWLKATFCIWIFFRYIDIYQWIIDIRLKRNLVEVPRENSFSSSEGEKIQKRVYIISGKCLTFIIKVPTFGWFCDHHFDVIIYTESQKRFRQKFGKVQNQTRFPPTNSLVRMHAARAPQVRVVLKIISVGPNSKLQNEYNCGIAKHIQFLLQQKALVII
jgi:hypothetical protein